MKSVNPATGETIKEYETHSAEKVAELIEKAHQTYLSWKTTTFEHRAGLMKKAAMVLRDNLESYSQMLTDEMGKPIKQARAETEKCAWVCDFYADKAEEYLKPEMIETDASKSYISYRPIGVVLAVMPWNFPFWQVFRFAAPSLMAGNVGILKHASNVPGSAIIIQDVFEKAGMPDGAFTTLLIGARQVASVIENSRVRAVTLTGSTPAGKSVASKSGEMLKKTVLELGGSDPYIILEDADLDAAVETCVTSRMINGGQSCVAAKRFIVVGDQVAEFEKKFVERMEKIQMGDPNDEATELGPQARHDLRDELHEQVKRSVEAGAKCLTGGEIPDNKGAYYPPTVITNVKKGIPAYEEELFGPVATIIPVKDEAEAIHVANDTVFGLGGAVFSRDAARAERIANEELDSGCCFVNAFVRSDPRLPFGGVKESGYGRELSYFGIQEFTNVKTVYVK